MIKTRSANTNDHCGRLEKAVKFTERQLLEKIDTMKDKLSSELKNDFGLDSNKEDDNICLTSNETETHVSVPSATNSFSSTVHAEHQAKRSSSKVNLERRSEKSTHLQSPEPSSASNVSTANSVNKFENSAFNVVSRQTEVVVLMVSNRKYLD